MIATAHRTERGARTNVSELILRIQSEYDEMPGLCLTSRQARRLWGIDRELCAFVLSGLLEQGFLRRTRDGLYVRARH
jgi:predicted transcriptional regulator of viral defense system